MQIKLTSARKRLSERFELKHRQKSICKQFTSRGKGRQLISALTKIICKYCFTQVCTV